MGIPILNTNQTKPSFHHGALKQALLEASLAVLDELGPDAITIREVARRAGVSHAAPVNHFKNRKALLTEIAVVVFNDLKESIFLEKKESQEDDLRSIKMFPEALVRAALKNPNRYRMLWRRDLVDNNEPRLINAMDSIYDELIKIINEYTTNSEVDPHTVAIGLWSLAHGYASMRLDGNFEAADDKHSSKPRHEAMVELFLAGLEPS